MRNGKVSRFGLITTNTITQVRQRKVIDFNQSQKNMVDLIFAISDHPWTDQGADVRIAMSAAELSSVTTNKIVQIGTVTCEEYGNTPEDSAEKVEVSLKQVAKIFSDLKAGADISSTEKLVANSQLSCRGMEMRGAGFLLTREEAISLGYDEEKRTPKIIKRYLNGRDLTDRSRNLYTIDLFGLSIREVQDRYPNAYQWVYERVKPERDVNRRKASRDKWWVYGEARATFRPALQNLERYIATVETAKHRTFIFLDIDVSPDNMLISIALGDAYFLGVLSSRVHVVWALGAGGVLEDRPRYQKTVCFDPFPFPDPTETQKQKIRDLGERLDAHRKRIQAANPEVTITAMYNLLEKLRKAEPLDDKDKAFNQKALVSTLKQIHDELDVAVFEAYGWEDLGIENGEVRIENGGEMILERLVKLNADRAEEERNGKVRWLRPDYQAPHEIQTQQTLPGMETTIETAIVSPTEQQKFPKAFKDQLAAIRDFLRTQGNEWTIDQLSAQFKGTTKQKATIPDCLESLETLGIVARHTEDGTDRYYLAELQKAG